MQSIMNALPSHLATILFVTSFIDRISGVLPSCKQALPLSEQEKPGINLQRISALAIINFVKNESDNFKNLRATIDALPTPIQNFLGKIVVIFFRKNRYKK